MHNSFNNEGHRCCCTVYLRRLVVEEHVSSEYKPSLVPRMHTTTSFTQPACLTYLWLNIRTTDISNYWIIVGDHNPALIVAFCVRNVWLFADCCDHFLDYVSIRSPRYRSALIARRKSRSIYRSTLFTNDVERLGQIPLVIRDAYKITYIFRSARGHSCHVSTSL